MGEFITTTSRAFLVGSTGLGKTLFAMSLASAMACGADFLQWRSQRPCQVLYVDGEMPGGLMQTRINDALRRLGIGDDETFNNNLFIYSADTAEAVAEQFPYLGTMPPLNTPAGHAFIFGLIDALNGVDAVIFDNVMSLCPGDQKEEVAWTDTQPLVMGLTKRNIGQLWLDHTGHDTTHQYGTSTKSWKFDSVALMEPLPNSQQVEHETGFKLSFSKARRRTPDNWKQFAPSVIRLANDAWGSVVEGGKSKAHASAGMALMEQMALRRKILGGMRQAEVLSVRQIAMQVEGMHDSTAYKELIENALPLNDRAEVRENSGEVIGMLRRFLDPASGGKKSYGNVCCEVKQQPARGPDLNLATWAETRD